MTTETLQTMIRATPFEPFALHLADGETVPVPHPEMIAHAPGSRTVHVALAGEDFRRIDLLLVVSIGPLNPAQSQTG
jgi:hypothetical protein